MGGPSRQRSPRQAFFAALLLGVVVFLNAAAVLPVLHHLAHQGHACDEPDCVVVALAQGKVDPASAPMPPTRVQPKAVALPLPPVPEPAMIAHCPLPPGRGPPA